MNLRIFFTLIYLLSEGQLLAQDIHPVPQTGHSSGVSCMAISQDNALLVSGGLEGDIILWNLDNFREIGYFTCPSGGLNYLRIDSTNHFILGVSVEGTLYLWDIWKMKMIYSQSGNFLCGAWENDSTLCLASENGLYKLNIIDKKITSIFELSEPAASAGFSPDNSEAAFYLSSQQKVFLWPSKISFSVRGVRNIPDNKRFGVNGKGRIFFFQYEKPTLEVSFSKKGNMLIFSGGIPQITSLTGNSLFKQDSYWGTERFYQLALHEEENEVIAGDNNFIVWVWDFKSGSVKQILNDHYGEVYVTKISPNGSMLLSGGEDRSIMIYKKEQNKWVKSYRLTGLVTPLNVISRGNGNDFLVGDENGYLKRISMDSNQIVKIQLLNKTSSSITDVEYDKRNNKVFLSNIKGELIRTKGNNFNRYSKKNTYSPVLKQLNKGRIIVMFPIVKTLSLMATLYSPDIGFSKYPPYERYIEYNTPYSPASDILLDSINNQIIIAGNIGFRYRKNPFYVCGLNKNRKPIKKAKGHPFFNNKLQWYDYGKIFISVGGKYFPSMGRSILNVKDPFRVEQNRKINFWNAKSLKKLNSGFVTDFDIIEDICVINDSLIAVSGLENLEKSIMDQAKGVNKKVLVYNIFCGELWGEFNGEPPLIAHPDKAGFYFTKNRKVNFFNIDSLDLITSNHEHIDAISSLTFDKENKLVLSAGQDGQIKIWDSDRLNEIVSLYLLGEDSYMMIDTNLYYYSNRLAFKNFCFKQKSEFIPFEHFDLRLNRPDKVLSNLPYFKENCSVLRSLKKAYEKRLEKYNMNEQMINGDFNIPNCIIRDKKDLPSVTTEKNIVFSAITWDSSSFLNRINVFVNDVPIYGIAGINLRPQNTKQHEQIIDIELAPGENKIQISVLNQAGAESLKETVYVTCTAPVRKPNLYLIGIGVGKFGNPSMNLTYPAKDIKDMAQLFQKNTSATYENVFVDTILDASLTADRLKTLKEKLLKTRVDDRVVLLIAGHGIIDDSLDYYFATYHTDFSHPRAKAMPYEAIENLLDSIPARQKLMLMDACHAGEIDKENVVLTKEQRTLHGNVKFRALGNQPTHKQLGLENSFELMKELFVDLRRGTGATIIASAGGVESAMEGDLWNNSAFMYALLTGLQEKKADLNKDSAVMVSELQAYLGAEVEKLTDGNQRPTFRAENISNDWRLW